MSHASIHPISFLPPDGDPEHRQSPGRSNVQRSGSVKGGPSSRVRDRSERGWLAAAAGKKHVLNLPVDLCWGWKSPIYEMASLNCGLVWKVGPMPLRDEFGPNEKQPQAYVWK